MNNEHGVILAEVKKAFIQYMDTYFVKRDLEGTMLFFNENMIGFGTGLDETARSVDEFIKLYERDLNQVPNTIKYEIMDYFSSCIHRDVCIVCAITNIQTTVFEQSFNLNHLRLSLTFVRKDSEWTIANKHISLPTVEHEGDESYPIKELEERKIVLQRLVDKKTEDLKSALKEIGKLANTDKLTNLYNRNILDEHLEKEIERSSRYGNTFSIIMVDIDHFKDVNDVYGHIAGDEVLVQLSNILLNSVRKTDVVGRWGGEEFLVISPETNAQNACELAEKLRCSVESHSFKVDRKITLSAGVTSYVSGDTSDTLLTRADKALYSSKQSGRNKVIAEV